MLQRGIKGGAAMGEEEGEGDERKKRERGGSERTGGGRWRGREEVGFLGLFPLLKASSFFHFFLVLQL